MNKIRLIDCPRDAMQGIKSFIPTSLKVQYINSLLKIGFHTLDCGSFVSPKAIPQMKDTGDVLEQIDLSDTQTKILVIVANYRGARAAVTLPQVDYLGFPFSISETFQLRNTNATREEAFERIREIQDLAGTTNKKMVIYFSMCFGNPYGDLWHPDIITYWAQRFREINIHTIALSDTIGIGNPKTIGQTVKAMSSEFDNIDFGVHLHTKKSNWKEKIDAAFENGCTRFDGAIKGYGGCPMAQDELVGNMPSENLISYFEERNLFQYDSQYLLEAFQVAKKIF